MSRLANLNWLNSWASPLEGPLTLLTKFAIANPIRSADLVKILSESGVDARKGNSLLGLGSKSEDFHPFVRALRAGALDIVLGSGEPLFALAGYEQFRYCPTCLDDGYQSSLCQIAWLRRCPQHGDALIAHCRQCGCKTPRYMAAKDLRLALRCTGCSLLSSI